MPAAALEHVGQQPDDHAYRTEVIELHRALEIVEAIVSDRDRAADRAAGIVDDHVDVAEVREDARDEVVDGLDIAHVGGIDEGVAPRGDDLRAQLLELLDVRATIRASPAVATCRAVALPIPEEAPVISTILAVARLPAGCALC